MKLLAKQILTFIIIFLLTIVIDYIFFVGIAASIPEESIAWILDSFAFSIVLLFWMFLGIPATIAYLAASKLHQAPEDYEGQPFPTAIALATAAVLGILTIVFFFNVLAQPKFLPYTFHGISESEFAQPTPTPTPIPESTPSATPTFEATYPPVATISADPTMRTWKTYTNSECKFSFKYPSGWFLEESSLKRGGTIAVLNYDISKAPGRSYDPKLDRGLFKIEMSISKNYSDVSQWYEAVEKNRESITTGEPVVHYAFKNIEVGGQPGVFYETEVFENARIGHAVFEVPPKEFLIIARGYLDYNNHRVLFNQILSTFKFLD